MTTKPLNVREVISMIAAKTGVTFTSRRIFDLLRSEEFPEPSGHVSVKERYWSREAVDNWISERFAVPDPKQTTRDPGPRHVKQASDARRGI
jgi:predicted DNA-binding transcriptional regulator AlpA